MKEKSIPTLREKQTKLNKIQNVREREYYRFQKTSKTKPEEKFRRSRIAEPKTRLTQSIYYYIITLQNISKSTETPSFLNDLHIFLKLVLVTILSITMVKTRYMHIYIYNMYTYNV